MVILEFVLIALILLVGGRLLATGLAAKPTRGQLCGIVLVIVAVLAGLWRPRRDFQVENYLPRQTVKDDYVSSSACRSCHPGEYHTWHRTFHRTMTQVASPEAVRGNFDAVELVARGREYKLYRDGAEFWIRMADPEWEQEMVDRGMTLAELVAPPMVNRRVLMTTGSHHYQTYWIAGSRGRELFQVPWVFHLEEERWLPRQDAFIAPPDSERAIVQWNVSCIACHSTGGNPGLQFAGGTPEAGGVPVLESEVGELGISCEACHGPGAEHVRRHQNPLTRYQQHLSDGADPTIVNPAKVSSQQASQICGQCHSIFAALDSMDWWQHGSSYRPGQELTEYVDLHEFHEQQPDDPAQVYWGDGTCRVGGREYLAMTASACFLNGELSCLSCHSLHDSDPNDQLSTAGLSDEACLQCHAEFRDRVAEHTHHLAESTGSRCYNCHMPHTSYALFSAIRSHRVDSPSAAITAATGRPNACNQCHVNQSLAWATDHLTEWYKQPDVELSDNDHDASATLMWLLKGDAVQRTLAAWTLGWQSAQDASGREWIVPFLTVGLEDPYPSVRFVAWKSLRSLDVPIDDEFDFLADSEQLAATAERVRQAWEAEHPARWTALMTLPQYEPFFDEQGRFDLQAVRQMQSERDDRAIVLPE